mgnify:CR=1 FL=1
MGVWGVKNPDLSLLPSFRSLLVPVIPWPQESTASVLRALVAYMLPFSLFSSNEDLPRREPENN